MERVKTQTLEILKAHGIMGNPLQEKVTNEEKKEAKEDKKEEEAISPPRDKDQGQKLYEEAKK